MRLFKQKRDINAVANDIKIGSTIYVTKYKMFSQKGDTQKHKTRTAWTVKEKLPNTLLIEQQDNSKKPRVRFILYEHVATLLES